MVGGDQIRARIVVGWSSGREGGVEGWMGHTDLPMGGSSTWEVHMSGGMLKM